LTQVVRRFAIDPDRIAIMGRCATNTATSPWARYNSNVFSRVIVNSGGGVGGQAMVDPQNTTTQVLIISGYGESEILGGVMQVKALRSAGHPATQLLGFRGHEHQWEDYYFIARWLQESWAIPDPARRPAPAVVANPLPRLNDDAITRMATFWQRFGQEPDSIRITARRRHLCQAAVPVGDKKVPLAIGMTDMAGLAAQYPTVAADLKAAGLTAAQQDAYRIALVSAEIILHAQFWTEHNREDSAMWSHHPMLEVYAKNMAANPVLAKNVAYLRDLPDWPRLRSRAANPESPLGWLEDKTGMWHTP